ncbi:hypothetical protein EVAR_35328_1 [Eumeta japonica]|uniref:Uncharacterized protein n=1 Tax=Eumeta variegata TaxID=151549 RepID=A0A4C1XJ35_EUMVA|nr:hypothetical protein EVAR_35328_1 [Eumeta japonica]
MTKNDVTICSRCKRDATQCQSLTSSDLCLRANRDGRRLLGSGSALTSRGPRAAAGGLSIRRRWRGASGAPTSLRRRRGKTFKYEIPPKSKSEMGASRGCWAGVIVPLIG